MPTPKEIMREAALAVTTGEKASAMAIVDRQSKALDAAGYVIESKIGSLQELDTKIELYEKRLESMKAIRPVMIAARETDQ